MAQVLLADRVRSRLEYDPKTGIFVWLNGPFGGRAAGCECQNGHRYINIDGRLYLASRLAWFYVHGSWPLNEIDHINQNSLDNRLSNLREATRGQNNQNTKRKKNNKSGYKGVCRDKRGRGDKWLAQIMANGKRVILGRFETPQEAYNAYCAAAKEHHGEFARLS